MNKLISRNPVLRFKLGRKIVKAEDGWRLINGRAVLRNVNNAYDAKQAGDIKLTHRYIVNGKQYGSFDGGKTYYGLNDGGRPLSYKANRQVLDAIGRRNKSKVSDDIGGTGGNGSTGGSKGTRGTSHYFFGNMGGWNRSMGNNIADQESLNMIKEMGMEGKSALDIQNKINEEFGSNAVKADNRWGILSKAGLKALYDKWKINKPEMSSFLLKIISLLPNLDVKSITPENVSIRKQIAMDGYKPSDVDLHLINISNTITNKTPTYVTANRSETRDWMRSNGINPYSVTGAMRAAARRLRAGQADDNDRLLVKGNEQLYNLLKGYYKQGGQLPSRNVVERFKQGKKILFAKRGTYFSVTVGKNTYLYNPYNGTYKGTLSSGENISYKDIANAFNKQYESVKTGGNSVYRKRGSRTTWTNQDGKLVNLAPKKAQQTNNSSFKTSANGRFRVVDLTSGKELRFDSRDEAKKYQMSATKLGTRVLYDDKKEGYGVLKVDRTKEKSTEWARNLRETNNNKSFKDAYNNARSKGDRWFAYQGKVYNSNLKDYKNDNLTEMKAIYGNDLGWGKDPKYNTKSSAQARNAQNKEIKALNSNRNANYKGKTNKLASTEADKKVAQTYNEEDLVDAFLPATAFGNGMNYLASTVMGEDYHPEVFHSGLNPAVGMANLMRGEWNKVGERALNAASVFGGPWIGKGVKWLGTKMAPEITNLGSKSAYLSLRATIPAANGTGRTLNKMAERAVSGNFTSPTTTYGRYSLQNAANNGVLDQFAVNGGFNNAARWGDRLVRNNNTGTGYIFRSGTTHPYDAAVDAGTKVIPWATSLGTPVVSTTLHNLTED